MKKVALVFVVAVLAPSLVLAWLALRSLRDQQLVLERQQALICQTVTDSFAKEINNLLAEQQREFNERVESLVTNSQPQTAAAGFDERLRKSWSLAEVGFCVTLSGSFLCPSPASSQEAKVFCYDNGGFLANRESAEVYWNDYSKGGNGLGNRGQVQKVEVNQNTLQNQAVANSANSMDAGNNISQSFLNNSKAQSRKVSPAQNYAQIEQSPSEQNISKVVPAEAEFRQLIGEAREGMMARFLQNKLRLMFWHRLEHDPQFVFGAQLNMEGVRGLLRAMLKNNSDDSITPLFNRANHAAGLQDNDRDRSSWSGGTSDYVLVILDDNATPVAATDELATVRAGANRSGKIIGSSLDLKHPLVATEIGEALPHWEVAAYLTNPDQLRRSARTIQLTLGALILVLVLAIGVGSWLIGRDINRQLTLARQKTDFVSNVSHELKTPLTSIRMFSELLAEERVVEPEKRRSYLNIITAETARLTRLINNVLDFSRMERGEKKYNLSGFDLVDLVRETAETYRPHLEAAGFRFEIALPESSVAMRADRDAVAQVIVNLLSNAEKYSNGAKEIRLELERQSPFAEVRVLDRGPGVPCGCEQKIFEQFYRADDSLSSGVQGSGLGLTLARQIGRAHGGDVTYEPREGGGSCFTLRLPVTNSAGDDVKRL